VCIEFESGIHAEIMQLSVAQQNQIVCGPHVVKQAIS